MKKINKNKPGNVKIEHGNTLTTVPGKKIDCNSSNESLSESFIDDSKFEMMEFDDQDENEKLTAKCYVNHNGKFRMRWDLFVILLVIYNCISIPFDVSFGRLWDHLVMDMIDSMIDIVFFLDIIITFFTTYLNQKTGRVVYSLKKIATNYLLSRFWVDLAASVPFELFISPFTSDTGAL